MLNIKREIHNLIDLLLTSTDLTDRARTKRQLLLLIEYDETVRQLGDLTPGPPRSMGTGFVGGTNAINFAPVDMGMEIRPNPVPQDMLGRLEGLFDRIERRYGNNTSNTTGSIIEPASHLPLGDGEGGPGDGVEGQPDIN